MRGLLPPKLTDCAQRWSTVRRIAVAAAIVMAVSSVGLLALSGWFITAAAVSGAAGPIAARAFNYLIPSALIRLLAILRTVGRYFDRLLSHRAALSTLALVRTRLFAKAGAAEATGKLQLSGGEAAALLGNDIDQLEDRLIRGPAIAAALVAATAATALGAVAGAGPAVAIAAILGSVFLLSQSLAHRLLPPLARAASAARQDLKTELAENAAASGEIAVWGLTDRVAAELGRTAARQDAQLSRLAKHEAMIAVLVPAAAGIASAMAIATAGSGAALAAMAALAAAAAGDSLAGFVLSEIKTPAIDTALERLGVLASTEEPKAFPQVGAAPTLRIEIESQVCELEPGTRVAILGRSGTGKTRLLETLAGLRRDAPQKIFVDGRPARDLGLYAIRHSFALVPQSAMLIAGTIVDNLRIARPGITEPELWNALETACFADEVRAFAGGLCRWIGEGGDGLSGGQRKRLAIARALLSNRPWLLLDEPSEGLDAATESKLVRSLERWLEETGTGLLLVSHRPRLLSLTSRKIRLSSGDELVRTAQPR